eukprot:TRINITY_DN12571_c0_g1_i2.p1 TRINITY_DN12571_c0_g1~~TRINITY_DN12571_c0_g1_i2.p1  ORF type:complete len:915 (-),score=163.82 TRINITY_DN12571_c0_g1_i2:362-3106(-)
MASFVGNHEAVKILLSHGANPNLPGFGGFTPFHHASRAFHHSVCRLLKDSGAFVDAKDSKGMTSIHYAITKGRLDQVDLLCSLGASLTIPDKTGATSLHLAARFGHDAICQYLLSKLNMLNFVDLQGNTPLHDACKHNKPTIVQILLKSGANPSIPNHDGQTAVEIAAVNKSDACASILSHAKDPSLRTSQPTSSRHPSPQIMLRSLPFSPGDQPKQRSLSAARIIVEKYNQSPQSQLLTTEKVVGHAAQHTNHALSSGPSQQPVLHIHAPQILRDSTSQVQKPASRNSSPALVVTGHTSEAASSRFILAEQQTQSATTNILADFGSIQNNTTNTLSRSKSNQNLVVLEVSQAVRGEPERCEEIVIPTTTTVTSHRPVISASRSSNHSHREVGSLDERIDQQDNESAQQLSINEAKPRLVEHKSNIQDDGLFPIRNIVSNSEKHGSNTKFQKMSKQDGVVESEPIHETPAPKSALIKSKDSGKDKPADYAPKQPAIEPRLGFVPPLSPAKALGNHAAHPPEPIQSSIRDLADDFALDELNPITSPTENSHIVRGTGEFEEGVPESLVAVSQGDIAPALQETKGVVDISPVKIDDQQSGLRLSMSIPFVEEEIIEPLEDDDMITKTPTKEDPTLADSPGSKLQRSRSVSLQKKGGFGSSSFSPNRTYSTLAFNIEEVKDFVITPGPRVLHECLITKRQIEGRMAYTLIDVATGKLLLLGFKKINSKTPNYSITLAGNCVNRSHPNFIGKLRGNFMRTTYSMYDKGTNPARTSRDMPISTCRSELGMVMISERHPRNMTLLIPIVHNNQHLSIVPMRKSESLKNRFDRHGEDPDIMVLHNRLPSWHAKSNSYQYNFHGRPRVPHERNFQLEIEQGTTRNVVLQLGSLRTGDFGLDFMYPLSAFQSFCAALASLDTF